MTTKPSVRPAPRKLPGWIDTLVFAVLLVVVIVAVLGASVAGVFGLPLLTDEKLGWHLVRAAGMTAYALLGASSIWGFFLSSRIIKDWAPGTMSLLLHASVSWLAVIFSFAHAGLLLFDTYYAYKVSDLLIPFTGPYRPFAVGLGTASAWLVLIITLSFSMKKLIGQKWWRLLHYTSYATFALVSIHAVLSGTDASRLSLLVLIGIFSVIMIVLVLLRVTGSIRAAVNKKGQHVSQL